MLTDCSALLLEIVTSPVIHGVDALRTTHRSREYQALHSSCRGRRQISPADVDARQLLTRKNPDLFTIGGNLSSSAKHWNGNGQDISGGVDVHVTEGCLQAGEVDRTLRRCSTAGAGNDQPIVDISSPSSNRGQRIESDVGKLWTAQDSERKRNGLEIGEIDEVD
eukprot:1252283-Rhodomonas_salina.1